jgi:hypothetical protein
MSSTSSRYGPSEASDRQPSPPARWKTSARIEALNRQQAAKERAAELASRRWATLHAQRGPRAPADIRGVAGLEEPSPQQPPQPSLVQDDRLPAWLVSLVVHMVLVLVLALVGFQRPPGAGGPTLRVRFQQSDAAAENIALVEAAALPEQAQPQPVEDPAETLQDFAREVVTAPVEVPNPLSSKQESQIATLLDRLSDRGAARRLNSRFGGGELGDRSPGGRAAAVEAGETTAGAEDALESALRWLAEHQHGDGGWSFRLDDPEGPCRGQCDDGRRNPDDAPIPRTAATGLALLAFMGAGSTHYEGPYAQQVQRGLYYLRSQARDSTLGTDLQNGSMYGHGIATLALAEAYVLTGDEDLKELVQGTTFFCAGAQHPSGGWGYRPVSPPDITLTAWQVLAIKTAEQQGIRVPTDVIPDAKAYLETLVASDGFRFGYKTPEPTLPTTAIGLLLRLYFGWLPRQTTMREGLDWLVANGPSRSNVYYNYYAMLALHHARHPERDAFARSLREHLIATQGRAGHERGSWHFPDRYGSVGGRLYTTALCCLILETPYRYVPMHGDRPFAL